MRSKDEEILDLKKNKKITDYTELKIKNEILSKEFNKLKEMYLLSLDMNKKNENFGKNENILKSEIQTQHDIIIQLNQEIEGFSLERKKLKDEIKDLKNKLEISMNNNRLIKNKKNNFEKKYKKNIKEQVIKKEYEEEKQEMLTKINKLQKNLDHYRLIAMKTKDFGAYPNKNKDKEENKNNIINNNNNNKIGREKNEIIVRNSVHNPEENYDNKTLLMQSIITELINEKKELLEKLMYYENMAAINKSNNGKNDNNKMTTTGLLEKENTNNNNIVQPKSKSDKMPLLNDIIQANEEILIADNNANVNEVQNNNQNNNIEDNNVLKDLNPENENKNENNIEEENIIKEDIKFDDIFSLNLEYKNINSSNAKKIFDHIFVKFKDEDKKSERYKDLIMASLVDEICLKLNCNKKEEEKKNIYDTIKIYLEQDEDFEDIFYIIFDNVINHDEQSTKIIDNEYEDILKNIFKNKKNIIEDIIKNNEDKIRIDKLYDILFENNIKINKNVFLYLCYKLKTDDCDSLYDIEIKGILRYIE